MAGELSVQLVLRGGETKELDARLLSAVSDGSLPTAGGDRSLRRSGVAIGAVLALAASCTRGGPVVTPSMATPTNSVRSSPTPSASPVVSERLVLRAELSERPARWQKLFFVPFGRRSSELGFKFFHESVNSQPSSFSVAADGSVWIADRLYALFDPTGGPIAQVKTDGDGDIEYLRPQLQGRGLWVAEIFPSEGPLTILVGGLVNPDQGFVDDGPSGFFHWVPPRPPEQVPGLPNGKGSWIELQRIPSGTDQDFKLQYLAPGQAFVQPFHVEVRTDGRPAGRSLPAEVGPGNMVTSGDDVLMYVMLTPARPRDASRYGGGRWLLRLGRSPVLWERLPNPGISDEAQGRYLALRPDGGIYLMVAKKGGMLILRRP